MQSYKQIAKATSLIGFVQIVQIVFGVIRNKVVAIIVGASGFGIWSLYNSYIEMVAQFSSLGLDKSGVRQIAKQKTEGDNIAKTIFIFRTTIFLISTITTIISIIFSKRISVSLFQTEDYYLGVILVSFVILFNGLSNGQKSILNGLRDLKGLAISQIAGSIVGSITAIVSVYFLGVKGIPVFIFVIGITAVTFTWWYTKKLKIKPVIPTIKEFKYELRGLLKVGLGFSVAGIIAAIMTYFSRIYLSDYFSIEAVGIYQASWTISNLYIGMILSAMGVDLMPRLMKVVNDGFQMNKLVNEQMELGVLISSIGIIAILIFSPLVLRIFYSKDFMPGVEIIRWQVLGVSLRVLGFPFSHSIMAKEKSGVYILVQAVFWITDFLLLVLFSKLFGFNGLGANYFFAYLLYFGMTWYVCAKLFDFKPSKLLINITLKSFFFILSSFFCCYLLYPYNYLLGGIFIILNVLWINYTLRNNMSIDILRKIKTLIKWK